MLNLDKLFLTCKLVTFLIILSEQQCLGFLTSNVKNRRWANLVVKNRPFFASSDETVQDMVTDWSNEQSHDAEQRELRFSGVGRLYVNDVISPPATTNSGRNEEKTVPSHLKIVDRLADATVAVVGLGGVGSWAAEALCRSGIGNIILLDLDDICISNTNRQLHALSTTVGKMKIDEMKHRLIDINPSCNVTNIHDFVTTENADGIIDSMLPELTVCLDAIDGHIEKTALIAACCRRGVPIVTCGGAAGRIDPTQIVCDDLTKAADCRLLFSCRKKLRDQYNLFPKGPSSGNIKNYKPKKWNIAAVFSTEIQKSLANDDDERTSSLRRCDGALGTACFVTGTYGFVAASQVVSMIANKKLKKPRIVKYAKSQ